MRRILVAFASREGQTEKIAHHIARRLEDAGHLTRLIDLKAGETEAGADDCDAAILAGAIHRGHHEQALARFIMRHAPALRRGHSAFLSVSVSAGSHNRADLQAVDEVVQGFLYELGWHPDCIEHVAGARARASRRSAGRGARHAGICALGGAHARDRTDGLGQARCLHRELRGPDEGIEKRLICDDPARNGRPLKPSSR